MLLPSTGTNVGVADPVAVDRGVVVADGVGVVVDVGPGVGVGRLLATVTAAAQLTRPNPYDESHPGLPRSTDVDFSVDSTIAGLR